MAETAEEALAEARRRVRGSAALSRRLAELGVHLRAQSIVQWRVVPANRVLAVEEVTGVSRYRLRPDIFGADPGDVWNG